jgi:hypothetical protein
MPMPTTALPMHVLMEEIPLIKEIPCFREQKEIPSKQRKNYLTREEIP